MKRSNVGPAAALLAILAGTAPAVRAQGPEGLSTMNQP